MRTNPPAIRRLCLAADVESYSRRPRPEQLDIQNRLLWTMVQACRAAGVKPARCDRQDSGDGQILILPPGIDESTVLPNIVLGLLTALHRVNNPAGSGGRIRLRLSIGQGAIQVGATGFVAPAVVTVSRLVNSDELRAALAANPADDAAFVVMEDLYHDMFTHGYGGLPVQGFSPVCVSQPAKGFTADAWIQVPGPLPVIETVPAYSDTELQRRQQPGAGTLMDLVAAAAMAWAVFAGHRSGQADFIEPADHGTTDHGTTDHGTTDHGTTDHGTTDHGTTDHGTTDHGTTDHGTTDHGEPGHFEWAHHLGPDPLGLDQHPPADHHLGPDPHGLDHYQSDHSFGHDGTGDTPPDVGHHGS